ncbi:MAG: chemotaxis protein CheA [Deltaproteobacteria bacterium]|nr:chemotaxis protein CheA [Deltaproteobacteria bacterium]
MAIDRGKYRRMFIEEAREGLRALGNHLVELEKLEVVTADGARLAGHAAATHDAMDAAFRVAHSLKGMGAAMGYTAFAELAHRLEDLADIARQGRSIGSEGYDLLLEGSDRLEELVERVAAGHEDLDAGELPSRVAALVERLRAQQASTTVPTESPPPAPRPVVAAPPGQPTLLAVRVRIADDASLPQVRAFVVHKALAALAGWRETHPPPDALRTKELPGRTLTVRFDPELADTGAIERTARAAQGVAEVTFGDAEPPPAPVEEAAPAPAERPEADRTVRVRTALLDEFIDSVGELLLARSRMRALASRVDLPELFDLVDEVERLTRDLHARVVAARMTPLSFLTERFPRVVRDLARQARRSVDFTMTGMDIELDRAILDELSAPFLHMLRNAIDHAHEGDEGRKGRGKPAAMKLQMRASRDRDNVLLELEDDGVGLDPVRLRRRAVERGLITQAAADALGDAQAVELICMPGFSTAEAVTQTSGRGVGMDVVKATLERLGGVLRIDSTLGRGTRIGLELPLTVAIIQVLVVEAGAPGSRERDAYAIPINRVEQAVDVDAGVISTARGRPWAKIGNELVPLYDLSGELGYAATAPRGGTVLLVGRGADTTALRVDGIVGQEEVVAKPLGPPLSEMTYLAGATLLADGRAAFILDPLRLVRAEAGGG